MGLRPSSQSSPSAVTKHIGTDMDDVRIVADNIDNILTVAANVDNSLKYLGAATSPPLTRLDGTPLEDGDYFLNTLDDALEYYDLVGLSWLVVDPVMVELNANNAEASAAAALVSETNANADALTASNAAISATVQASNASGSASTASTKADEASVSAAAALNSENISTISEDNASASAALALSSENNAATSAGIAVTSANEASTFNDKAEQWAEEVVDVPIEIGKYSALHHATKAAESETNAAVSESNANDSADLAAVLAVSSIQPGDNVSDLTNDAGYSALAKSNAEADTILDNADAGNIGKTALTTFAGDVETLLTTGFYNIGSAATNTPAGSFGSLEVIARNTTNTTHTFIDIVNDKSWFKVRTGSVWGVWQEILSGASDRATVDNAETSNVGKLASTQITDINFTVKETGFYHVAAGATGLPVGSNRGGLYHNQLEANSATQLYISALIPFTQSFRSRTAGIWNNWQEVVSTVGDRDTIENARVSGVGRQTDNPTADFASNDANSINRTGFYKTTSSTLNTPSTNSSSTITHNESTTGSHASQLFVSRASERVFFRTRNSGVWGSWLEFWQQGNTGTTSWDGTITNGTDFIDLNPAGATYLMVGKSGTATTTHAQWRNANGIVGAITTNGSNTAYNTASDPRLKDFKALPTDNEVNTQFNLLFGSFRVFDWKADGGDTNVWGFDAHVAVDSGTGVGTEGDGPRDMALGSVYEAAVFEDILTEVEHDEVDEETGETTTVLKEELVTTEIAPAKLVTSAGVDQSKAVPILLAKIEQLERRLAAAGL